MKRIRKFAQVMIGMSLATTAAAYGDGAPICHVNDIYASPMGNWVGANAPIFTVRAEPASYLPGETLSLLVEANGITDFYNGLLLYVEDPHTLDAQQQPTKVGSFVAPLPPGFRSAPACEPAMGGHTLTHDDSSNKLLPTAFGWIAPSTDLGTLHLRAIVLRIGTPGDWTNHPYQTYDIALPSRNVVFNDSFE